VYYSKVRFWAYPKRKNLRRNQTMAVPARHTSKSKKNKRRTHYKMTAPTVTFDETTGDYRHSHRVSLKGYYKGRQVKDAK
jgi:large subunit ribosomal protein L32